MAVPTSFKQQCPSCEAMVPIRDPKLIGRKIDCPKCKYRFIVEEPADEVEDAEEAAPVKKGKAGAGSITAKKPAAKAGGKRRADDDQDMDESVPKKKQGGSGMLIVGIGLAAVAVLALGVGGFFLLSDSGSDDGKSTRRSSTSSAAPTTTEKKKDEPPPAPKETGPRPRHEDITNLLPNDTQFVLNMPLEHLLGNAKANQALLKTPGSFHEGAFQNIWGISPSEIRRVVVAANVEKQTLFCVMRTSAVMKEKHIVEVLNLKSESAINGFRYYLLKKPLDALSTALLKGAMYRDKVAMHFMDPFTVVCADPEPMKQFLQDKGQPKQLSSKKSDEEEQPQGGGQGGFPGMQGGPSAMPGGPRSMPGGPRSMPGGPQMPGGPSRPRGGPPSPPSAPPMPGGGPRPMSGPPGMPGGGGFRPPPGLPGGMAPRGVGEGSGEKNGPAPMSSSYMTIDPHLKAVLDQVEKVDKTENQNVLLSTALSSSALTVEHVKKLMTWARTQSWGEALPQLPDLIVKTYLDTTKSYLKAAGLAVTDFDESKVAGNVAVAAADAGLAQYWERKINENVPDPLPPEIEFISPNTGGRNMPGMPNMNGPGMPNMPRPPMGGSPNMPRGGSPNMPNMPRPPMGGAPNMPNMPRPPMGGAPNMPQGGPGMMQPTGQGDEPNETTKLASLVLWLKENVIALGVTYNFQPDQYKVVEQVMEIGSIYFRGVAAMSDRQWRIHELAAATQAYLADKGSFPRGAVIRPFDSQRVLDWRPDQRLSWMTQLLPYVAGGEFKDLKLEDGKSWYEGSNIKAAMTLVPQFVTPSKSGDLSYFVPYPNLPIKGADFWAATHFVGIAGVGLDAADYRGDDAATAKKRGIFGYDRETKKADIKDGLDQTILLIQTPSEPKSPWLAGGGSTVRGISEDLDCVQPFVCTEYQGKRGTFAIMADGKVRFIAANINPKTFQAMCTIAGGDKIGNIEKEAPEVPPEESKQAELKTEKPAAAAPSTSQAPKEEKSKDWKQYTSKEGGFSVSLPSGKVTQQTQQVNTPAGKISIHIYGVELSGNAGSFLTIYSDYPQAVVAAGADKILDGAKAGVAAFVKGAKITRESRIKVAGHPGREWTIDLAGKGSMKMRVFLVKNRLIQLLAGSETGKAPDKDIQTFFDSFKLTAK